MQSIISHSHKNIIRKGAVIALSIVVVSAFGAFLFTLNNYTADAVTPDYDHIYGQKWLDMDEDGNWGEEPELYGWDIVLFDDKGDHVDNFWTEEGGYYDFEVPLGTYYVCEVADSYEYNDSWTQTYPHSENGVSCEFDYGEDLAPWGHEVVVVEDDEYGSFDFGNYPILTTIEAYKFHDENANGEWDESESAIAEWEEICLEEDGFDDDWAEDLWYYLYDDEENCQNTDENGYVSWNVPASEAEYYLYENIDDEGWFQTYPSYYNEEYDVEVYSDGDIEYWNGDEGYEYYEDFALFGNTQYAIHALKYWDKDGSGDRDDEWYEDWSDTWYDEYEPVIEGWEMCLLDENDWYDIDGEDLYDTYFDEFEQDPEDVFDDEYEFIAFMIMNEFVDGADCQETDASGMVFWTGLDDDEYMVIEEWRDGWFPTTNEEEYGYEIYEGIAWVDLDDFDEDEYVVELEFGNARSDLHAFKFFDTDEDGYWGWINEDEEDEDVREPVIRDWEICLEGDDEDYLSCILTDATGWAHWLGVAQGDYYVYEEIDDEENDVSWFQTYPDPEDGDDGYGYYYIEVDDGDVDYYENGYEEDDADFALFGNWIDDEDKPESNFDDSMNHRVVDTEIVSLSLSGTSVDPQSRVNSATMTIRQLGDEELGGEFVINANFDVFFDIEIEDVDPVDPPRDDGEFVVDSFFDVFYEIDCSDPELRTVQTEILSMDLTSVDPITVAWGQEVEISPKGIYCFEVSATDNAGNEENTAYAGPVAYMPVAPVAPSGFVISLAITDEEIVDMDADNGTATAQWATNLPSSSKLIYGLASDGPYNLNMAAGEFFGYPLGTDEDTAGVTEHSLSLSGLIPGEEYVYRALSGYSSLVIGSEKTFLFPEIVAIEEEDPQEEEGDNQGQVLGEEVLADSLYRILEDIDVWAGINGLKRYIPSPEAFEANGFAWEDVVSINPEDEPPYEEARFLRALGDVKVFLVDMVNLTKLWIETEEDFDSAGYQWDEVIDVPQIELDDYTVEVE